MHGEIPIVHIKNIYVLLNRKRRYQIGLVPSKIPSLLASNREALWKLAPTK
jgi:hypothetical protein